VQRNLNFNKPIRHTLSIPCAVNKTLTYSTCHLITAYGKPFKQCSISTCDVFVSATMFYTSNCAARQCFKYKTVFIFLWFSYSLGIFYLHITISVALVSKGYTTIVWLCKR